LSGVINTLENVDIRDALFDQLYEIASNDNDVIFLTADMGAFSLKKFKSNLPKQYFNVGISEQNLVSISAGLALGGKKVFIYAIAPFITQRCYEQIKVDLCSMDLPVTIIGMGPGLTYSSDGLTHHATQDIAIMRALPGMSILSPSDPSSASRAIVDAYQSNHPVYIRLDKGQWPVLYDQNDRLGNGVVEIEKGNDVLIVSTGVMVHRALNVAKELNSDSMNIGVVDLYSIKPIAEQVLLSIIEKYDKVVTLEEHSIIGGIGSAICEILSDNNIYKPLKRIALADDDTSGYGDRDWMHSYYGLDLNTIVKTIREWTPKR